MGSGKPGASGNPFERLLAQAETQAGRPASGDTIVCDECGTRAAMLPAVDVQLMSTPENLKAYVITGVGGLCRAGQHFICWKHMEFKNLDEGGGRIGRYVLACQVHGEAVEGITAEAMERWRARGGPELMKASREPGSTSGADLAEVALLRTYLQDEPSAAKAYLAERVRSLPPPQTAEEELAAEWLRQMTADVSARDHEKKPAKRHWYQRRAKARS